MIRQINEPGARFYEIEGVRYPSVTTVLSVINKPALVPWARNVALADVRSTLLESLHETQTWEDFAKYGVWLDEIIARAKKRPQQEADAAADVGTRAHKLIQGYLAHPEHQNDRIFITDIEVDLRRIWLSFKLWEQENDLTIMASEEIVCSKKYGYAGTLDCFGTAGSKPTVVDWKTSNALYPEYLLQVAAYAMAYSEMYKPRIQRAWVVRLGKDRPEFETICLDKDDIAKHFKTFLGALTLWRGLHDK